jgi:GTPase
MNTKRINVSIFYTDTINYDGYVILTEFFAHLTEEERSYAWLKQDPATSHAADDFLAALEAVLVTE